METLKGSQHPATLMKKCPECNFILKNHFHCGNDDQSPSWVLFCPNLTCPAFGQIAILYEFVTGSAPKLVDPTLISEVPPDTSIQDD